MIKELLATIYRNLNEEFRLILRITWASVSPLLGMGKIDGKFRQRRSCPITQQFPSWYILELIW
jgi:hypothetical protein